MLPTIGGSDNKGGKLEASGSFLSRMLGRSPSKGAIAPQGPAAAGGQQSGKGSAALFSSTQPPGGSLKTSINQGTASSNNWAISSSKEGPRPPVGRAPSAKNLEEAANRPSASPRVDKLLQASNTYAPVARIPSAQRLTPLTPAGRSSPSPTPTGSDASAATAVEKLSALDPDDADLSKLSDEELRAITTTLIKQKAALKNHLEAISGSGKPGSGAGMQQSASGPAAEQPARKSSVTFGTHRNSVLVVEFAKPEHQQRPSMIANTDQIKAIGMAAQADENMSFIEESSGKTKNGTKSSAALESGPSIDPLQAQQAAEETKRQLMLSTSIKKAEDDARKAAEEKRKANEAAAAAAAAAAGPSKPVSKRRYKLLSVFPLLPPAMRREEWSLSQFAVEKRLHKGYASEVYKARDIQSGEMMAVKVYNLPALGELNKVQLIREIRLHGSMAHRNIIELYVAFQEDSRVILAQKYADGGDLLKALHHAGGRLTEHSAVSMVIQPLLSCLLYLHSKGIIHRDIKPENILFDEGILKVADFGLALNSNEEHAVTRAGTLHYMAPEVVKNPLKDHPDDFKNEVRYHYNVVVDSWAVGCLAYELLAGYPPFSANTQQQVVHNINNMEVTFPKRAGEDAIDFIKAALERHPGERATSTELIKHPWIMQHMRRGSSRHLTLQPQSQPMKTTTDFASGITKAKQDNARRAADHGLPKESIMAPF